MEVSSVLNFGGIAKKRKSVDLPFIPPDGLEFHRFAEKAGALVSKLRGGVSVQSLLFAEEII
jgi:hypothetical protein